jgi:hypothetical protein
MRRTLLFLIVLFSLAACGGQATPEAGSYVSADGKFTFTYPPEWMLVIIEADNILDVSRFSDTTETLQIEVSMPLTFAAYTEAGLGTAVGEIVNAKAQLWQRFGPRVSPDVDIQTAQVTEFTVEGRPAAYARATIPGNSGINFGIMIAAVQVSDEHVVTLTVLPPQGQDASALDVVEAEVITIANSIRYTP